MPVQSQDEMRYIDCLTLEWFHQYHKSIIISWDWVLWSNSDTNLVSVINK